MATPSTPCAGLQSTTRRARRSGFHDSPSFSAEGPDVFFFVPLFAGRPVTQSKNLSPHFLEAVVTQNTKICWLVDSGLIPYSPACELQRRLVEARKVRAIPDVLLLCEHPHVITLGRNARPEHLLTSDRRLAEMNVELRSTDRGGDITYHGPGQIIGYPVLDLAEHRRDVRWYVEQLEEVMIRTTADFGLPAKRVENQHGVWINAPSGEEKLGALGVHLSRWVTSHGFAYNVSTDLRYFDLIVPCGIADKRVTSLERALGRDVSLGEVRSRVTLHFSQVFGRELVAVNPRSLEETLRATRNLSQPIESTMV